MTVRQVVQSLDATEKCKRLCIIRSHVKPYTAVWHKKQLSAVQVHETIWVEVQYILITSAVYLKRNHCHALLTWVCFFFLTLRQYSHTIPECLSTPLTT